MIFYSLSRVRASKTWTDDVAIDVLEVEELAVLPLQGY